MCSFHIANITKCLFRARYWVEIFAHSFLLTNLWGRHCSYLLIMRKRKHRRIEQLAPGHGARAGRAGINSSIAWCIRARRSLCRGVCKNGHSWDLLIQNQTKRRWDYSSDFFFFMFTPKFWSLTCRLQWLWIWLRIPVTASNFCNRMRSCRVRSRLLHVSASSRPSPELPFLRRR